jgi:hypothetical protein
LCVLIVKIQAPEHLSSLDAVNSPAVASVDVAHRHTGFGLNLSFPAYWSRERAFMNLTTGGNWQAPGNGWKEFDPARIGRDGMVSTLAPGEIAALGLVRPAASYVRDVAITCRYRGMGKLGAIGANNAQASPGRLDFIWPTASINVLLRLDAIDPADPIRELDCREANADRKAVFDGGFVDGLRPYRAIRYLDWQAANNNVAGDWEKRTLPTAIIQGGEQGVAVEHLVALANLAGVDPWFVMPWNADATYVANFAQYVHDHLAPGRTAYVENGNEIWNLDFAAAKQALAEGERARLGANPDEARMRRYAQKSVAAFKIWERIFADNPKRIVRVLSGQNAWPELLQIALNYKDTSAHIDALATAPYFGQALLKDPPTATTDLAPLFVKLDASIHESLDAALRTKEMADSRGLRYLGYEGGQHVTYSGPDRTLITRLNRDPRMGESYRKYLAAWDRQFGDVLMLLASAGPPGANAAFGMVEYSGQPIDQTPKRKAVLEAIRTLKR